MQLWAGKGRLRVEVGSRKEECLGCPQLGGGPFAPSFPTPHSSPFPRLPPQPAAGEAIRIPLIAFFHRGAFLCSERPLIPPLSRN